MSIGERTPAMAVFAIRSVNLSPDQISGIMGLRPTESEHAGQPDLDDAEGRLVFDTNGWIFSSEGLVNSNNIADHLTSVVDRIQDKAPELTSLRAKGCTISLSASYVTDGNQEKWLSTSLNPELLEKIAKLGLALKIRVDMQEDIAC